MKPLTRGLRAAFARMQRLVVSVASVLALLIAPPALAAAGVSLYRMYIEQPQAAIDELQRQIRQLEDEAARLAERAEAALAQRSALQEQAVATIRFYDQLWLHVGLAALLEANDIVDYLSVIHVLERMVIADLSAMQELVEQHALAQQLQQTLNEQRRALANREALLPVFREAQRQRHAFQREHPDPLSEQLELFFSWQRDEETVLALLAHLRRRFEAAAERFTFDPAAGRWELDQDEFLDALLPLPAHLDIERFRLFILPDYLYWVFEHQNRSVIMIAELVPQGKSHLRLQAVEILYRGLVLDRSYVEAFNQLPPLRLPIGRLAVDDPTPSLSDRVIRIGP